MKTDGNSDALAYPIDLIRERMLEYGMSVEALAIRAGVHRTFLSRLFTPGNPPPKKRPGSLTATKDPRYRRILNALGLSEDLLEGIERLQVSPTSAGFVSGRKNNEPAHFLAWSMIVDQVPEDVRALAFLLLDKAVKKGLPSARSRSRNASNPLLSQLGDHISKLGDPRYYLVVLALYAWARVPDANKELLGNSDE